MVPDLDVPTLCNALHLNPVEAGEGCDCHRRARGRGGDACKKLIPDVVHARKVSHVSQKNLNINKGFAGESLRLENRLDVGQHALCLGCHVHVGDRAVGKKADSRVGVRLAVAAALTGDVENRPHTASVTVACKGAGQVALGGRSRVGFLSFGISGICGAVHGVTFGRGFCGEACASFQRSHPAIAAGPLKSYKPRLDFF
jgi:hypothetical protein